MIPLARRKEGTFLGVSVFSTVDEPYKHGGEATFGVYRADLAATPGQGTTVNGFSYPIDVLIEKPNFAAMRDAYK